jgi:hypothetical protein
MLNMARNEGRNERAANIAHNLNGMGMGIDQIMKATGLSQSVIAGL